MVGFDGLPACTTGGPGSQEQLTDISKSFPVGELQEPVCNLFSWLENRTVSRVGKGLTVFRIRTFSTH